MGHESQRGLLERIKGERILETAAGAKLIQNEGNVYVVKCQLKHKSTGKNRILVHCGEWSWLEGLRTSTIC